jgi:hypothetical protein
MLDTGAGSACLHRTRSEEIGGYSLTAGPTPCRSYEMDVPSFDVTELMSYRSVRFERSTHHRRELPGASVPVPGTNGLRSEPPPPRSRSPASPLGDPLNVPEAGDHSDDGAHLRDHLRDRDEDGPGHATTEGLLPIDQHEGSQERDRHRESDNADLGGRSSDASVRTGCTMTTPDCDQAAVVQVCSAGAILEPAVGPAGTMLGLGLSLRSRPPPSQPGMSRKHGPSDAEFSAPRAGAPTSACRAVSSGRHVGGSRVR